MDTSLLPLPAHKRPRTDAAVELGQLSAPTLFTAITPRPRLLPLYREKRASAVVGSGAGAAAGAAVGGVGAAAAGPVLVRSPTAVALDDYLTWVGSAYYTSAESGAACGAWAVLRRTTLGRLTAPTREALVFDDWSPLQIAKFEAAICLEGKNFPLIANVIGTKTTMQVIEFYYAWKQSKNYAVWKISYKQSQVGSAPPADEDEKKAL